MYRDNNQKDRTKLFNIKLGKSTKHQKLKRLEINEVGRDFNSTSMYPTAMWDEKSVYPKLKSGFVFKEYITDVYVEAFNNQTFHQDFIESVILKIKFCIPPNLIFQHLPVK